jgi:transcriptional regulator with AAA-type ATPase domain
MSVRTEQELLAKLIEKRLEPSQGNTPRNMWETLRLALESQDSRGRRKAAAEGARYWRNLPIEQKGANVRLLSGLWTYHYLEKNQYSSLNAVADRILACSRRTGIVALQAEGLLARSLVCLADGNTKEAIEFLELSRALFISTKENDSDGIRSAKFLADVFRMTGDLSSATAMLERARSACLELEEIPLLASVTQTLGLIYADKGLLDRAICCFRFARASSEHIGSYKRVLYATLGLAMCYDRCGRLSEARELAQAALIMAEQFELPRDICLAHEFLGRVCAQNSEWHKALWHYSRVHKKSVGNSATKDIGVELQRRLTEFWLALGQLSRARKHLEKGLALSVSGAEKEDSLALRRLGIEISGRTETELDQLVSHAENVRSLNLGYEHLLSCRSVVSLADELHKTSLATEWWARVEFLAKSCGAEPLLERWRKERQEKGYLPQTSPDGLDGEPGPHSRLAQELPTVDLAAYNIITRSRRLHEQAGSIKQVAPTTVPVLIHGESGTGKELFARLVHDLSPRVGDPFLAINCGALPSELLESELFGHRRGSFTGAIGDKAGLFRAAHKGTLFLDEIGEMTPAAQTKLLRVLEAGEVRRVGDTQVEFVDVRIVAATNVDLEREVKSGKFRQDLYYRLKGLEVFLPPLRERMSDIPLLADHFLSKANQICRKQLVLPFETKQWLMGLAWMGNVRELRLAVERATALGPEIGMLQPYHFMRTEQSPSKTSLNDEIEEIERSRVLHALDACNWNKAAAAKLLGMSRTTLGGRIKRLGLDDPRE